MKAIAVCMLISATAWAEPSTAQRERARQIYESACTHYRLHELEMAAREFRESYEIVPRAALLFNIAQTYRQLHRNADALFFYRQYLATAPPMSPASRKEIGDRMAELQSLIDRQAAVENAPPVDAEPRAAAAPAVQPQPARVELVRAVDRPAPWYRSGAGWGLLGGGLAIAGAGAGLLAHGTELDGQIGGAGSLVEAAQLASDRDRFRSAGIALLAVGGAAAASGVIVFGIVAHRSKRGAH